MCAFVSPLRIIVCVQQASTSDKHMSTKHRHSTQSVIIIITTLTRSHRFYDERVCACVYACTVPHAHILYKYSSECPAQSTNKPYNRLSSQCSLLRVLTHTVTHKPHTYLLTSASSHQFKPVVELSQRIRNTKKKKQQLLFVCAVGAVLVSVNF